MWDRHVALSQNCFQVRTTAARGQRSRLACSNHCHTVYCLLNAQRCWRLRFCDAGSGAANGFGSLFRQHVCPHKGLQCHQRQHSGMRSKSCHSRSTRRGFYSRFLHCNASEGQRSWSTQVHLADFSDPRGRGGFAATACDRTFFFTLLVILGGHRLNNVQLCQHSGSQRSGRLWHVSVAAATLKHNVGTGGQRYKPLQHNDVTPRGTCCDDAHGQLTIQRRWRRQQRCNWRRRACSGWRGSCRCSRRHSQQPQRLTKQRVC